MLSGQAVRRTAVWMMARSCLEGMEVAVAVTGMGLFVHLLRDVVTKTPFRWLCRLREVLLQHAPMVASASASSVTHCWLRPIYALVEPRASRTIKAAFVYVTQFRAKVNPAAPPLLSSLGLRALLSLQAPITTTPTTQRQNHLGCEMRFNICCLMHTPHHRASTAQQSPCAPQFSLTLCKQGHTPEQASATPHTHTHMHTHTSMLPVSAHTMQ